MNHASFSPTDGNGPTQGQRKTLTRVGNEPVGGEANCFLFTVYSCRIFARVECIFYLLNGLCSYEKAYQEV